MARGKILRKLLYNYGYIIKEGKSVQKKSLSILVVVVVVIVAAGAYMVYHKPSKTTSAKSSSGTSASATRVASQPAQVGVIQTKTDSKLGQYLADAGGNPLYTYAADTAGKSNCSGSCLYSWPVYDASKAPATLPANVTVITRDDGSKQYAYKGLPLYTFTSDSSGQPTGDGVSDFHLAKP